VEQFVSGAPCRPSSAGGVDGEIDGNDFFALRVSFAAAASTAETIVDAEGSLERLGGMRSKFEKDAREWMK